MAKEAGKLLPNSYRFLRFSLELAKAWYSWRVEPSAIHGGRLLAVCRGHGGCGSRRPPSYPLIVHRVSNYLAVWVFAASLLLTAYGKEA